MAKDLVAVRILDRKPFVAVQKPDHKRMTLKVVAVQKPDRKTAVAVQNLTPSTHLAQASKHESPNRSSPKTTTASQKTPDLSSTA